MAETQIPPDIPDPPTDLASFREGRAAEARGEAPKPETTPAPPDLAAAEADANSQKPDTEVSEAARLLRKNRADARKAKIQDEISALTREREDIRRDIQRQRDEAAATRQPGQRPPPPPPVDPRDPEPTLEAWVAAHPQDPDPYSSWQRELGRWDRRQEARQAAAARAMHAEREHVDALAQTFGAQCVEAKTQFSDFEAVVAGFDAQIRGNPRANDLGKAVMSATNGARLLYHLATHPDDARAVLTAPDRDALFMELGRIRFAIAPAPPAVTAPVTQAPPPHTPVGAAGGASSAYDPAKSNSLEEWRKHRERVFARG